MNRDNIVAVIGAGRMGIGISQVFAYAGYSIRLIDAKKRSDVDTEEVLRSACRQISDNLYFLASLGLFDESLVGSILKRINYYNLKELEEATAEADIVFEAVPEVLTIKEEIYKIISSNANEKAIIASTTSTFLADTLAQYVNDPERFLNTHWLNPAYLVPLVEVSPGNNTSTDTLERMISLLENVGKVPVKCAASPGFIVPRIQALAMNEAARLVEEGVATPEEVDKASRYGFGIRFAILGLLEFIDWGGGDILFYASQYLKGTVDAERFEAPSIISENMANGNIGMKTGKGFYDFTDRNISQYQKETIKKFVDLLKHMGLLIAPQK